MVNMVMEETKTNGKMMNIQRSRQSICLTKVFFITFLITLFALPVGAEPTPRWVKKGVAELNRRRTNDSYSFHIFHQEDINHRFYQFDRFAPLLEYIDSEYNVDRSMLRVDSIPANGDLPVSYMVTFEKDGIPTAVYARLVDKYQKFEDYADNTSEYNFYQLYAISNPGYVNPDFDKFTLKKKYGIKPLFMSVIPGLGQIYKGESAKGYTILGIEAAMIASTIYATTQVHKWNGLANENPTFYDSYQSKASTFRQWRAFCLIAGGALYVYNLLDAALANGARYVDIQKNNSSVAQIAFTPYVSINRPMTGIDYGITMHLTF